MPGRPNLDEYARRRDRSKTPEPTGGSPSGELVFVVQHHLATGDHYDFRLEVDGVLVSWAVPKGPSVDPRDKRMAKRTEDHPLDYRDFEGVIPKGEYGGGTVMVWDRGTYEPHHDMAAGLEKGHLGFDLRGEKLAGGWSMNRMRDGAWLLVKSDDAAADRRRKPTSSQADSAKTGRTMHQIEADG